MELRPCVACHRHVRIDHATCPFCEATLPERAPHVVPRGRRSRAAVFATLATAACGPAPKPRPPEPIHNTPPTPIATKPVPDPVPMKCDPIAQPAVTPASASVGAVGGVIRDERCELVAGATVVAASPALQGSQVAITDEQGRFKIDILPPGMYTLTIYYDDATLTREVEIVAGGSAQVDLQMPHIKPPETIEIINAKPYGAPPARRRRV
jgi:hypothetical protein